MIVRAFDVLMFWPSSHRLRSWRAHGCSRSGRGFAATPGAPLTPWERDRR